MNSLTALGRLAAAVVGATVLGGLVGFTYLVETTPALAVGLLAAAVVAVLVALGTREPARTSTPYW